MIIFMESGAGYFVFIENVEIKMLIKKEWKWNWFN